MCWQKRLMRKESTRSRQKLSESTQSRQKLSEPIAGRGQKQSEAIGTGRGQKQPEVSEPRSRPKKRRPEAIGTRLRAAARSDRKPGALIAARRERSGAAGGCWRKLVGFVRQPPVRLVLQRLPSRALRACSRWQAAPAMPPLHSKSPPSDIL